MIKLWIKSGMLSSSHFIEIQNFVDSMVVPSDIGRIPHKIESGFAGFKADQFKTWITIFSIPALHGILPNNYLECWRHFVLACRILRTGTASGGQSVTRTNGVQVNAACTSGQVQCRVDSQ